MVGSVAHQRFSLESSQYGFFLKCGASKSPNSQRFASAFKAHTALIRLCTVPFSSEHFLQRCPLMARFQEPNTRWPARRLLTFCIYQAGKHTRPDSFMTINTHQLAVGKYLVSPLAKIQGEGRFAASVSIRSGQGSATHDRVLRFHDIFETAAAAVHYATEHALGWIAERSQPACA